MRSLKTLGLLGGLLVVAVASMFLWDARGESVVRPELREPAAETAAPAAAAARAQPGAVPVRVPRPPVLGSGTDFEAAQASVWQRPYFARWVKRAKLTTEQERRALQILADAQAIYNESGDVRDTLRAEVRRLRNARLTPAQRARLAPVIEKDDLAFAKGEITEAEALVAARVYRETWEAVDAELDATRPESERQAEEAAEQVERDLEAQVKAAFSEFLTSEQVEYFDEDLGSVGDFLDRNYRPYANAQYAKELAAQRR